MSGAGIALAAGNGVVRHSFWLPAASGGIPVWLHAPVADRPWAGAAVICAPLGYEYVHSYRSLLHLADALAARGLVTLRFDYSGTGAAQGDWQAAGLVSEWLSDIKRAASAVMDVASVQRCSLIGVQLGATLAAATLADIPVETLVLWAPVVDGRRFVRERRLLSRASTADSADARDYLDGGGFPLSADAAQQIAALDLTGVDFSSVRSSVLLIDREDVATPPSVLAAIQAQRVDVEVQTPGGYVDMIAEPQYAVVPRDAIQCIASRLADSCRIPAPVPEARVAPPKSSCLAVCPGTYVEELVLMEGSVQLFGILTTPTGARVASRGLFILVNAGSVHQVGPNRTYVELTRALAEAGMPSLRLDLRNVGDSITGASLEENHPYATTATADISAALQWARARGFGSVVLAGLCSGAHAAFRAALSMNSAAIRGLVLVNPLTFRWSDGMSLDTPDSYRLALDVGYYRAAMRDPAKWRRLLTRQTNTRHLVRYLARRSLQVLRSNVEGALRLMGLLPPTALDGEIRSLARRGIVMDFIFSDSDPGRAILQQSAARAVRHLRRAGSLHLRTIVDADHTFSKVPARQRFIQSTLALLRDHTTA